MTHQLPLFAADQRGLRMAGFVSAARRVFDQPAPARRDATDTSRGAARAMDSAVGRLRRDALAFVWACGEFGATFDQWAESRGHPSSQSGRFTELADAGLIADTGKRRRTRSGVPARVFTITESGKRIAGRQA